MKYKKYWYALHSRLPPFFVRSYLRLPEICFIFMYKISEIYNELRNPKLKFNMPAEVASDG